MQSTSLTAFSIDNILQTGKDAKQLGNGIFKCFNNIKDGSPNLPTNGSPTDESVIYNSCTSSLDDQEKSESEDEIDIDGSDAESVTSHGSLSSASSRDVLNLSTRIPDYVTEEDFSAKSSREMNPLNKNQGTENINIKRQNYFRK